MKRSIPILLILLLVIFTAELAGAEIYSISPRYRPAKEFPSLQQKIGSSLGIAPFKDKRTETLYIGSHLPLTGSMTYFKSNPFPLEKALQESLMKALVLPGIKITSAPNWDGTPESLKKIETDSILMIEIKNFWSEGKASLAGTNIKTTIELAIYLGVKKDGKVYTKIAKIEKEIKDTRSTPEKVELVINQILTDMLDNYFSSPY